MPGQLLYVLTTLMSSENAGKAVREWRPVGLVSNETTANRWSDENTNNDWIPLQLDDLSLTGLADPAKTPFSPRLQPPTEPVEAQLRKTINSYMEINQRLMDTIEHLATRYKDKEVLKMVQNLRGKKSSKLGKKLKVFGSELLNVGKK